MLQIVADANIPLVDRAFGGLGTVRTLPGGAIDRAALARADVLLVRSVTRVDAALLAGTPVRFVGSATAGTDHVDRTALAAAGVAFAHAPGSNATSVVEYVLAALLAVAAARGEGLAGRTLGVVGAGAVGGRLIARARALGMDVVVCDPPLAATAEARGERHAFVPVPELLRQSDVVTLHTPLTTPAESPWPTVGLLDADAFAAMRPGAWLVNAARGRVVDGDALRAEVGRRPCVLDVWPGEPSPDPETVAGAALGTPHIAGYSADGKVRGTQMLAVALRDWLADGAAPWDARADDRPGVPLTVEAPPLPADDPAARAAWLDALARQAYSIRGDDARFRAALAAAEGPTARAEAFTRLRKAYPERREWARYTVTGPVPAPLRRAVAEGLAMRTEG